MIGYMLDVYILGNLGDINGMKSETTRLCNWDRGPAQDEELSNKDYDI